MGKLKKTSPYSYSTTGTKPSDWGVDPTKPFSSGGDRYITDPKEGLKKASRKQRNTKNIDPFNNKGRNA
jgi:hypothetical protein